MSQKTEAKKPIELENLFQILKQKQFPLPSVFVYVAEDSFEFDIVFEHYKDVYEKSGTTVEIIVYVAETGDHSRLFAELFTPDMFFPNKLLVLKNGSSFFKPLLDPKASQETKDIAQGFQKNFSQGIQNVHLLVHYDSKDLPASFSKLVNSNYTFYKPKTVYANDIRRVLGEVLDQEHVELEPEAWDEFVHKISPQTGAYLKNIRKLKLFLNKKRFSKEDVENVLFGQSSLNIQSLVESFLGGRKGEFFKEFTKFQYDNSDILAFLSRLNSKLDEIRKFKVIRSKNNGEVPIPLMDEYLKTSSFSDKRKFFLRNQWVREANSFTDKTLLGLYEILIDLNIKFKSGLRDEEGRVYFNQKILEMFQLVNESTSMP